MFVCEKCFGSYFLLVGRVDVAVIFSRRGFVIVVLLFVVVVVVVVMLI